MKKTLHILKNGIKLGLAIVVPIVLSLSIAATTAMASSVARGNNNTRPDEILDRVVGEANKTNKIQDTQFDKVSDTTDQQYAGKYKIANTLNSIRINAAPYLQWFMFIGLSVATVLIIITGFQLVTSVQSGMDGKKALGRIKNIAIGIAILTGFYIITRIFMSLLGYVLT